MMKILKLLCYNTRTKIKKEANVPKSIKAQPNQQNHDFHNFQQRLYDYFSAEIIPTSNFGQ